VIPPTALGFLAPMPSELKPLQRALSLQASGRGLDAEHTGSLDDRPVVALLTGIGMGRAAARTRHLLAAHPVEHVVVIGVAGGLATGVVIGDVVVPEVVVDLTDGRELRPSPLGTAVPRGRLLTSDDFITDQDSLGRLRDQGATAIDMETAAVARVCEDQGCRWSVFRGISDDAFDPLVDEAILGLTRPDGSPDIGAVARFVAGNPTRVRLLARLGRDLRAATTGAVDAALRAARSS
jgi:adenosylhomocysteine nucleosidase